MKTYNIKLTEPQVKLLKQALLCTEINREKEGANGIEFETLHINIDEQLKAKKYLNN